MSKIQDLQFNKGTGALFKVEHEGKMVKCFVTQDNEFLTRKASPGQIFPNIFNRYTSVIYQAAVKNIQTKGIDSNPWGNHITAQDIQEAQREC
ncbi:hypothetical protein [Thalassotalea agarivorans]|nr:hypothetical protein [Thalassotalea agarivorans]